MIFSLQIVIYALYQVHSHHKKQQNTRENNKMKSIPLYIINITIETLPTMRSWKCNYNGSYKLANVNQWNKSTRIKWGFTRCNKLSWAWATNQMRHLTEIGREIHRCRPGDTLRTFLNSALILKILFQDIDGISEA
jgi:hypothetical protein